MEYLRHNDLIGALFDEACEEVDHIIDNIEPDSRQALEVSEYHVIACQRSEIDQQMVAKQH